MKKRTIKKSSTHLNRLFVALHQFTLFPQAIHVISKAFNLVYHVRVSLQQGLQNNQKKMSANVRRNIRIAEGSYHKVV